MPNCIKYCIGILLQVSLCLLHVKRFKIVILDSKASNEFINNWFYNNMCFLCL